MDARRTGRKAGSALRGSETIPGCVLGLPGIWETFSDQDKNECGTYPPVQRYATMHTLPSHLKRSLHGRGG